MRSGSKERVVKVNADRPAPQAIREAARVLEKGGVVAFPTETYYGLGADPFHEAAVRRLFEIKDREPAKPISLVIDDEKRLKDIVKAVSPEASRLIRRFWPGPLTLVFHSSPRLPAALTGGSATIGVRIPNHPVALELLRAFGRALTATSANHSGQPSAATAEQVEKALGTDLDLILDAGPTPGGPESTVVDATLYPPRLIRKGPIPFRDVLMEIGLSPTEDHDW